METYKNPFYHSSYSNSKPYYDGQNPIEYRGYRVYHRIKSYTPDGNCYDVVKDGICITMMASIRGACRAVDKILKGDGNE